MQAIATMRRQHGSPRRLGLSVTQLAQHAAVPKAGGRAVETQFRCVDVSAVGILLGTEKDMWSPRGKFLAIQRRRHLFCGISPALTVG